LKDFVGLLSFQVEGQLFWPPFKRIKPVLQDKKASSLRLSCVNWICFCQGFFLPLSFP
jgi:hypothetical protein